jgi:hypothetical protein
VFLALILFACGGDQVEKTADSGADYFPLKVGLYQIYDVHEIKYSEVTDPDTSDYQLLTEVVDSFPNTAGSYTYVIYRSSRQNENSAWEFIETWSARKDNDQAVEMEGNISYVKLQFPLAADKAWNGNKLNNGEEDMYTVKTFDTPFAAGGTTFDKTLTVEQELNDDPIVYTDIRSEVYGREVGLVYKETTQLRYCQSENCAGNEVIDSGLILKQQIIEYGVR